MPFVFSGCLCGHDRGRGSGENEPLHKPTSLVSVATTCRSWKRNGVDDGKRKKRRSVISPKQFVSFDSVDHGPSFQILLLLPLRLLPSALGGLFWFAKVVGTYRQAQNTASLRLQRFLQKGKFNPRAAKQVDDDDDDGKTRGGVRKAVYRFFLCALDFCLPW